jgi:hypothetical protein
VAPPVAEVSRRQAERNEEPIQPGGKIYFQYYEHKAMWGYFGQSRKHHLDRRDEHVLAALVTTPDLKAEAEAESESESEEERRKKEKKSRFYPFIRALSGLSKSGEYLAGPWTKNRGY